MKKVFLVTALCLSICPICSALNSLVENFTGPNLDPTWGLIEGGGAFNGLGQYTISDNGSKGVNGISRIVGTGDFECHFDANVSFGGAHTKLGFEFWDDSSALSTFDAFLVQLFIFDGTNFQLVVYQWTNGVLSSTTVFNNNTVPTSVSYKITWTEATKQWGLSYGINGEARDAHVANLAGLPAYGMGSAATRRVDIWVDHWTTGSVATADLDYFKIFEETYVFTDNFNTSHDYLSSGVSGTGWDGFVGQGAGETVNALNSNITRPGNLYMESTNARWEPNFDPLGPFLYKIIVGDFTATVKVEDSLNMEWNDIGIMARVPSLGDAGAGEDFECVDHFISINQNMVRAVDNGIETEVTSGSLKQYLRLSRIGDAFYHEASSNGMSWTQLPGSPRVRTDMADLALQVGLQHANYNSNTTYVVYEDFSLETSAPTPYAHNPRPADGGLLVLETDDLSFKTGDFADGHHLYFGTDFSDVNDAATSDSEYRGPADVTGPDDIGRFHYDVVNLETLAMGQTYYWRVDEVNDSNVWKGDVWAFTVSEYEYFQISIDESTGGLMSLRRTDDIYNTNYVIGKNDHPEFNIDDSRWVGDIITTYKVGSGSWTNGYTSLSDDTRTITMDNPVSPLEYTISYLTNSANSNGIKNFTLVEKWKLDGDSLLWTITFKNTSGDTLEFGSIGLPLLFNQYWPNNQQQIYEERVLRHSFIGLEGSFIYWQRPNGVGPFLVMTPLEGTRLEFYEIKYTGDTVFGMVGPAWEGLYTAYIHSKADYRASWFFPQTSVVLNNGENVTYGFKFRWSDDIEQMGDILYQEGLIDVKVVPGMVVPADQYALVDLHTSKNINSVTSNYPANTIIEYLGQSQPDHHIYRILFSSPGSYDFNKGLQNTITVDYGSGETMPLQFFATEPVEDLIKKRADFIMTNQQQNDPTKWAYRAYLMWDILEQRKITKEQDGSLPPFFWGGADDIGNAPPLFLGLKNVYFPDNNEIASLSNFLSTHVWGHMQLTDGSYAVYRWYPIPSSPFARSYDYVHVMNEWYHHYLMEKLYGNTGYISAADYLSRAYGTAIAFFTRTDLFFDGGKKLGNMGENSIPRIIASLEEEGYIIEAITLQSHWNTKINYFDSVSYPFGSEMYQDSTGFEASHALAADGNKPGLLERTYKANLANRGWQPAWYHYGGDLRWMGDSHYQLSYMTQLAGWALLDYALHYKTDNKEELIRRAYGSYLASWANIHNSNDVSDGAAKWVFHCDNGPSGWSYWDGEIGIGHYGAMLAAASIVVNDPIFGLFGYGCHPYQDSSGQYKIIPVDGIRQRLHMVNLGLSLNLDRDAFSKNDEITIGDSPRLINFVLENEVLNSHATKLEISGLRQGSYRLEIDNITVQDFCVNDSGKIILELNIGSNAFYDVKVVNNIDSDGDGCIDFKDFSNFALQWLKFDCGSCEYADFDCDQDVDYDDLEILIEQWPQDSG